LWLNWWFSSYGEPLTLDAYITFFLVPFIAASLIGEDKNTDMEGGWESMQLEGDQGEATRTWQLSMTRKRRRNKLHEV
jgi:hypothetical protein